MDFHLKGLAIGIIFLIFQLVFYKKIKNKVIRLIPLFIGFICLFFCFLLYLGYPPIETTFYSSNEFIGALAMVWCGYGIFGALLGIFFANVRKIFRKFKITEKLKKLKNINSVNKKLIIIIVILIIIESIAFKQYFGNINPYISELNIVYTPNKPAYKFHYWHWIDVYEYYVFRLSDKEEKIIIQEAENGNWSEMTLNHIDRIDSMDYGEFLDFSYRYHKCYVCIYDIQHDEIITDSENYIPYDTTQWVIFLYDTLANKYYCVFQTM